jgi:peptidoglycan L-alanyl-D-glutamate endopeptidase CwlK
MDKSTEERIKLLHPLIRDEVTELVNKANSATGNAITIRIVQGLRTFPEQDELYAQGRTKPGGIVTYAKSGQSYHNYGLAIDFAFLIKDKGEISWDTVKDWDGDTISDWLEVVKIFVKAGYTWGGTWAGKKRDAPHFEKIFNLNWREMRKRYDKKDFITGTKYIRI